MSRGDIGHEEQADPVPPGFDPGEATASPTPTARRYSAIVLLLVLVGLLVATEPGQWLIPVVAGLPFLTLFLPGFGRFWARWGGAYAAVWQATLVAVTGGGASPALVLYVLLAVLVGLARPPQIVIRTVATSVVSLAIAVAVTDPTTADVVRAGAVAGAAMIGGWAANQTAFPMRGAARALVEFASRTRDVLYRLELQPDPRFTYVNSACRQVLGFDPGELYADTHGLREHIHPDDLPKVIDPSAPATRRETVMFRWRHPDGSTRWLEDRPVVVARDEEGQPRIVQGVIRDVTEKVLNERTIRVYAAVVENMPLGLTVWRAEDPADPKSLRLVARNEAGAAFTGRPHEEVLGATIEELSPALAESPQARAVLETAVHGEARDIGELQVPTGLVKGQLFRVRAFPLPERSAGVVYEDVTTIRSAESERRRLLERIVQAEEEERRKLAEGLHSGALQQVSAASMRLDLTGHADEHLVAARTLLTACARSLRDLVFDLYPPDLDDEGLEAAVLTYAEQMIEPTGIDVDVVVDLPVEPGPHLRRTAYRIVQEALANVREHAGAAHARVRLQARHGTLELEIADDGIGMDPSVLAEPPITHIGLRTMRERATAVDGELRVDRSEQGGTRVLAMLPIER